MLTREQVNQLFSAYEVATDRRPWEQTRRNPYRVSTADFRRDLVGHWMTYDTEEDPEDFRPTAWKIQYRKDGTINVEYAGRDAFITDDLAVGDEKVLDDFLRCFSKQEGTK